MALLHGEEVKMSEFAGQSPHVQDNIATWFNEGKIIGQFLLFDGDIQLQLVSHSFCKSLYLSLPLFSRSSQLHSHDHE